MSRLTFLLVLPMLIFTGARTAEALIIETIIRVQVAGEVRRPGVYSLPTQSRVADAIQLAGGLKKGASLANLNLSSALKDGESVRVPNEEKIKTTKQVAKEPVPEEKKKRKKKNRRKAFSSTNDPVSLNSAKLEDLDRLPGIGPGIARDILAYRESHGGFRSIEELKEVDGIGEKRFQKLSGRLRL